MDRMEWLGVDCVISDFIASFSMGIASLLNYLRHFHANCVIFSFIAYFAK